MKYIFVIGGKSTALEIREVIELFHKNQYDGIYNVIGNNEDVAIENVLTDDELAVFIQKHRNMDVFYITGITDLELKNKYISFFNDYGGKAVNIIHQSSCVSPSAKLGSGNYIAANSVLSTNAIMGNHNLINYNVTIGHNVTIGSKCIFNPGVRIGGNVCVADNVLVGANSFIFQGKTIGQDVLIDAMTYIDKDIPDNSICSSKQLKVFKRVF